MSYNFLVNRKNSNRVKTGAGHKNVGVNKNNWLWFVVANGELVMLNDCPFVQMPADVCQMQLVTV